MINKVKSTRQIAVPRALESTNEQPKGVKNMEETKMQTEYTQDNNNQQETEDTNPYYDDAIDGGDEISSAEELGELDDGMYSGIIKECVLTSVGERTSMVLKILLQQSIDGDTILTCDREIYFSNYTHDLKRSPINDIISSLSARGVVCTPSFFVDTTLVFTIRNNFYNGRNFSNISKMTLKNWQRKQA